MRWLATLTVLAALITPAVASGQDYTFFDWAWDQGYFPGDAMPHAVRADDSGIDSLEGITDFDWTTRPTRNLHLQSNEVSSIESGSFSGLTRVGWLHLDRNQISNIESGAFSGLTALEELGLSDNQLSSVESGNFSGLTILDSLSLDRNQISSIESGAFSGLPNLTGLNLGQNQLSSVESGAFSGLTNLEWLTLGHNQISNIESVDFSGLGNLTGLSLDFNQISSLEPGDFDGLTNLESLNLYDNQISSIEAGDFGGLTNLKVLNLVYNQLSSIEPDDFTGLTSLTELSLGENQISSIEPDDFSGLPNLTELRLWGNQISTIESDDLSKLTNLTVLGLGVDQLSSIESGAFSELTNLTSLWLNRTAMTRLNLEAADFSSLTELVMDGNENITSVSLRNAVVNQTSLACLMDGGKTWWTGIGELDGITDMDLSGIDFAGITSLSPLYLMDDLTDLWLVDTENLDAFHLDRLLDNLATIEGTGTEGILYMTEADYDAFNAAGRDRLAIWDDEQGHHVEFLQIGDVNHDTDVNGLDVDPFVDVLLGSRFDVAGDMNGDGAVNGLDVDPFVAAVVGGSAAAVPEPSTLLLCIIALAAVSGWRKRSR